MRPFNTLSITALIIALILPQATVLAEEGLVIYSGRSDNFVKPVMEAFTEQTGIKVILHTAESTALLNKLRIEGARTQADLYLSNDAGNLQIGEEMQLFGTISSKIAENISPTLRSANNQWLGLSARARVLVVNNKEPEVKSVFDLADPRFKDRLAITSSSNESFIAGTTVYLLAAGKEKTLAWLKGIKTNAAGEAYNKHSKIVQDVADGKKAIGLVNHYYIYRHLDQHPDAPIRIVMPDQGTNGMGLAWNVAGIAVSKYSTKQTEIDQLLTFLVSAQGQRLFADVNREYPARADVMANPAVPPSKGLKIADVPMYRLGQQRKATIDLIEAAGLP